VLVDVKAAGINFADVMARIGLYPDAPKTPCVVGYEVAGTVREVGEGVEGFAEGDRVMAGTRFEGYSELVAANAADVALLPDSISFEQGAAVPVNYSTAYVGLIRYGTLEPGERVLIHAAAGGVGIAATQIAKARGAEVWGTASPGKHEAIRGFGVDHALDYTTSGWEKGVPEMDVVMDAVGGKSFRTSYDLLRAGGRLVAFGASAVTSGESRSVVRALKTMARTRIFHPMPLMSESKAVIGLNMLTLWDSRGSLDEWMEPLRKWTEEGKLKPVVAKAFPLEEGPAAHRYIAERNNVGKVVLTP